MRLIDADVLKYALGSSDEAIYFDALIDEMPTIEPRINDWTPCAEGMPVPHHKGQQREMFLVSLETGCVSTMFYEFNPNGYLGEGWSDKILTVIAWQLLPEPYNPDRKEDAE